MSLYWEIKITEQVRLNPSYLTKGTKDIIEKQLRASTEGQYRPGKGIILRITQVLDIGKGKVSCRTGYTIFDVQYKAIVFRPTHDMVIDAKVTTITNHGIHCEAGPAAIFIPTQCIPEEYKFVSDSCKFETDEGKSIEIDQTIRARLVTVTPNKDGVRLAATATIKEPYLGVLD